MTVIRGSIERVPQVAVCEAVPGSLVKIVGTLVLRGEPLYGPVSGKPCAQCEIRVNRAESMLPALDRKWTAVIHEYKTRDLWIDDGTGLAFVPGPPTVVWSNHGTRFTISPFTSSNPRLEAILRRHGQTSDGLLLNTEHEFFEALLEVGERVAARGIVRRTQEGAGYRDSRPSIALAAPPDDKIVVTDWPAETQ